MKKNIFTFSLIISTLILGYALSGIAKAQFIDPNQIKNIRIDKKITIPIAGISGIEGKSIQELTNAGCTQLETTTDGPGQGSQRLSVIILESQKLFIPTENATAPQNNQRKVYFGCDIPSAQKLLYGATSSVDPITDIFITLIMGLLSLLNKIGITLIGWSGKLLVTILGQGTFIQNDLVKQAWPFVQGIANLGFIFSLLYIALATTLRLESVSGSVQRLLPRLLIGALLVNFSLIIGGLLIDASRVVMAAEIQLIGGGEVKADTLGVKLLEQTDLYQNVTKFLTINPVHGVPVPNPNSGWNGLVTAVTRSFFILATAAGMAVLAFGLFERYIALLILLVISPLAYLAVTLPQTSAYAKKWWDNFIKWVLYGPILLFFLIIIIRVQSSNIAEVPNTDAILDVPLFQSIVKFIVVIALFFVASITAKKVGGAGSGAIVNWAQKNPRKAMLLGGAATGGLSTAVGLLAGEGLARATGRRARDFGKEIIKPAQKRLGIGAYGIYDDKGNLKNGASSIGTRLARGIQDRVSSSNRAMSAEIAKEKSQYDKNPELYDPRSSEALGIEKLTNATLVASLPKELVQSIVKSGTPEQLTALTAAISKDKEGKISHGQIKNIIEAANNKGDASHVSLVKNIVQKPQIVQQFGSKEINQVINMKDEKTTEALMKSLATDVKK